MKKNLLLLMSALGITLVMTACGGEGDPAGDPATDPATDPAMDQPAPQ
ncbi:hypothetical protein M3202_19385 [Alkalihalobacillus oceani]|uniref:Uncharacterized protein n=1 Tax=Halalkalibacter oceani TaxID=1653776 RepID=A0A9X2IQU2_9BACI|nr:hypothetical protein [Halalkalibacter oceani]MCM3716211.1 hypothetical protein [Halalkalibacter oceani]